MIDQFHKSNNTPIPYPTMHHSEQKCDHFCSEWCIMGYEMGVLWELGIISIPLTSSGWTYFKLEHSKYIDGISNSMGVPLVGGVLMSRVEQGYYCPSPILF